VDARRTAERAWSGQRPGDAARTENPAFAAACTQNPTNGAATTKQSAAGTADSIADAAERSIDSSTKATDDAANDAA
jgi:hypothetical protein